MKRFIIHEQKQINSAIEHIKKLELGGQWEIVVRKHVKKRSDDASRLYWLWLDIIAKETGNDKDIVHEFYKNKFGIRENRKAFGENMNIPTSTTKYSKKTFSEYMNQVEAHASQLGVQLPHSHDAWMFESGVLLQ